MDGLTILYSVLIAIAGTAAIIIVPNMVGKFLRNRLWRRFANLGCPDCRLPFGIDALQSGTDDSPFEELWLDQHDELFHVHPTCRQVVCPHCHRTWVLRHQTRGADFGPELEVAEPVR